jgi:hypothetical protein
LAPTVAICENDPAVPEARSILKPFSLLDASFQLKRRLAASEIFDQERDAANAKAVTSNALRDKSLAVFISVPPNNDDSFAPSRPTAQKEVLKSPGGPAAVSRVDRDLGQWLCVPPFRMVCPFLAFENFTPLSELAIAMPKCRVMTCPNVILVSFCF